MLKFLDNLWYKVILTASLFGIYFAYQPQLKSTPILFLAFFGLLTVANDVLFKR
ncbi:hypothetical protein [Bacillus badius]|uniref:Uncharacterized protein n=1 Tax=Bacillus badius TaxID=1455 RepID=A0ABR5AWB5_BACBA|nr:hypothetical protein [Bacillus badius]KIL74582.1 hypothetical protein SD78_1651 [Bacillus badius]KIL79047.1 hypothetical protein SD77_3848 [Bacillus badius]MED4715520.1 hypothetical protein [Bacillus badius]